MNGFEKYRSATVNTADTSQQLIFVFDEIMKLLHTAQKAMEEKDYETKFKSLSRVTEVLYILQSGVDLKSEDSSSKMLDMFYGATITQLEQINLSGEDPEELQSLIEAIGEVRTAINASTSNQDEKKDLNASLG